SVLFADQKTVLDNLSLAIGRGDQKLFQESLSQLKNVNQVFNVQKETPLTLAAFNDRSSWVEALIRRGAKLDHQTTTGYSALMFAAMAMNNGDEALKTVQILLSSGANRHLKNMDGKTALDLAMDHKQSNIVALLQSPVR